ncbi:extracellular solute-binding protein [Rhodobacteraceae bacterium F11138]|nr:extracellular solute-binding protein [Rhodobacteraceae bacterium F11138]
MTASKNNKVSTGIDRRGVLKGGAAAAGAALGSGVLGAPMIWAQTIRDITLNQAGPSYSVISDITAQASADLGFTINPQVVDTGSLMAKVVNQPETVDIADLEFFGLQKVYRSGNIRPVEIDRIARWDQMTPLMRDGKSFDGSALSEQGTLPFKVIYTDDASSTNFAPEATGFTTCVPTIYNADTLGIRTDLVERDVTSWGDLFSPDFEGRTALVNIPQIGIMDAAMAMEALGLATYGNKGNMTQAEIDVTIDKLIELKKAGHFRAFWSTFDESVNLMAAGEVVIQSMWSPAVTAVRARGLACVYQGLQEGYRGWGLGMSLMSHLDDMKRDAAIDYINWCLDGWQGAFVGRQGYYSSVPETALAAMTENERGYWYEGKKATETILDPYGAVMEEAGRARDGGSIQERMGNIACWNTVMDEDRYMIRRWNEFISS